MVTINKAIKNITPYKPGKPIEELRRQLGLKSIIKLASNENPLGPSPKAVSAIRQAACGISRYPEGYCFELRRRLSEKLGLSADNLCFGNGSDEIIDIIIKAFCGLNEEIITADATFLEYKIIAQQNGRRVKIVPLKNFGFDLTAIKKNITPKTKLIFIANPNNPTGTYLNQRKVIDFLRGLPEKVIVVFDEAYFEFVEEEDFALGLKLFKEYPNIIILRTFSKAYGLAGLRIGYAIAGEELIQGMELTRQPFNVNFLAQVAAEAALDDGSFLKKTRTTIKEGKRYLYRELDKLKVDYVLSAANFILIDVKQDGEVLFRKLLKKGVIVRELKQYGLDNFIRVTIGTQQENKRFIQALKEIRKSRKRLGKGIRVPEQPWEEY